MCQTECALEGHPFEPRVSWRLDPDLRAFYLYRNGTHMPPHHSLTSTSAGHFAP
jgi:hypothetical protein